MRSLPLTLALMMSSLAAPLAAQTPPPTVRGDTVDRYHGTAVADPYRWLEDSESAETRAWVEAQNAVTLPYLATLPQRAAFQARLTELWNFARYSVPQRVGQRRFYERNDGLQNQAVLWVQEGDGTPRVLLDPNTLSADGTVALSQWRASPDGRYLAYGLARAGSDWNQFRIRDVASGEDLPETLERIKFSGLAWAGDSSGIFYSRYPDPPADAAAGVFDDLADQALYFHILGSEPEEDSVVFAQPEHPQRGTVAEVSDDGRWLILSLWQGASSENALYLQPLSDSETPWVDAPLQRLVDNFEAQYRFVGDRNGRLYFLSTLDAPRGRILMLDTRAARPAFREVVAQTGDTLQSAIVAGNDLILLHQRDASHRLTRVRLDGTAREAIPLPGLGTVTGLSGKAGVPELRFAYTAFNQPSTVFAVDLAAPRLEPRPVFPGELKFDPADFVTEQVFVTSKDGTRVPMFISYKKGLDRRQPQRAHLYGYGGFDISLTPSFSVANLAWMDAGGIHAVANLRGGGEYGRDWHRAGTLDKKQNVFDDFIAAAGYLIDRGWTTPQQLAISGRSNGGLLVGAVVNQQPGLFGAAVAGVGVMDMLRFHKFTIGWAWTGDYGSSDDPEMFPHLLAYSPLHNVRRGTEYPAVLVTTADHDDRVVPGHSYKYAAAMQWAQAGDAPILIRIDVDAGHGAGKPLSKTIEEAADTLAFMHAHTAAAAAD